MFSVVKVLHQISVNLDSIKNRGTFMTNFYLGIFKFIYLTQKTCKPDQRFVQKSTLIRKVSLKDNKIFLATILIFSDFQVIKYFSGGDITIY